MLNRKKSAALSRSLSRWRPTQVPHSQRLKGTGEAVEAYGKIFALPSTIQTNHCLLHVF